MRSGCMGTARRSAVVLMSRKIKMAASCMTRPPSLTRRANRSHRLCSNQELMMHSVLRQVNLKETEKPISTWSASPISQTTAACYHSVLNKMERSSKLPHQVSKILLLQQQIRCRCSSQCQIQRRHAAWPTSLTQKAMLLYHFLMQRRCHKTIHLAARRDLQAK